MEPEALFEALIVPQRSLSPRGVAILSAVLAGISALFAVRFWMLGAWPVAAFSAVEIGLAVVLLRLNLRHARASELLLLSETELRIIRTDWRGRRAETALPSAWVRVQLDARPGRVSRLWVGSHGVEHEVGAALGEAAKQDLADALGGALRRARAPRFDNPQLT